MADTFCSRYHNIGIVIDIFEVFSLTTLHTNSLYASQ